MTTTMISGDGRYSARLSHGTPVVTDDEGGVWHPTDRAADRLERLAARDLDSALELAMRLATSHSPLGTWRAHRIDCDPVVCARSWPPARVRWGLRWDGADGPPLSLPKALYPAAGSLP